MYNMEVNLTELDNSNTMNPYNTFDYKSYEEHSGDNYWEKPKVQEMEPKKKKVSFNDILSNMNLVVNKQGVLQFMVPNQEEPLNQNYNYNSNKSQSQTQYQQTQYQQPEYQQPTYQYQQQNKNPQPVDLSVKHSYIFNKYFKDYTDPNAEKHSPRVPKTIEEYHQMLLEDRIKAIEHKKLMEQVKSKKMMFISAPGTNLNPRNLQATKNNLRMMNFR